MNGMIQLVLDKDSQELLAEKFDGFKFPIKHGKHITLAFRPECHTIQDLYPDGQKRSVRAHRYVIADGVETLAVTGIQSLNEFEHITLSIDKGHFPVESNDVLKENEGILIKGLNLEGTVRYIFFN